MGGQGCHFGSHGKGHSSRSCVMVSRRMQGGSEPHAVCYWPQLLMFAICFTRSEKRLRGSWVGHSHQPVSAEVCWRCCERQRRYCVGCNASEQGIHSVCVPEAESQRV